LLPEVADATRSIDEFRLLSERLLLYMQAAPGLFRMEAQLGEYQFAAQQETKDLLNSITAFSQAADRMATSAEMMPANIAAEPRARDRAADDCARERAPPGSRPGLRPLQERRETALFASLKTSERPSQEL
jgi:hypothetical protein